TDMTTTTYAIHPAIGVARLGSSRDPTADSWFYGPEPDGTPPANYRDRAGDLKRQAARFRVFECRRDERNRLASALEVAPGSAPISITWTVHLANRKGVARRIGGRGYRNRLRHDEASNRALVIDPGPRSVHEPGECQAFDTGKFRTTPVDLGAMVM